MKKNFYLKYATAAVALSLSMVAGQANASTWTYTTSGTITSNSTINNDIFGVGGDLTGLRYTDVVSLDPGLYSNTFFDGLIRSANGSLSGLATNTLTINGITQVFTWDLSQINNGQSLLANQLTQTGNSGGSVDEAFQLQSGFNAGGDSLYVQFDIYSLVNAFSLGLGFDQHWSYHPQPGDSSTAFIQQSSNGQLDFVFSATPDFFAINQVAATPLPQSFSLMLTGLGLVGFMARRKFSGMV